MPGSVVDFKPKANAFRQASEIAFGRVRDLAEDMVMRAKDNAQHGPYEPKPPNDTGNNVSTIKFKQTQKGHFIVYTESGYGGLLEIGTQKMPARPYLRDSYQQAKAAAERRRS